MFRYVRTRRVGKSTHRRALRFNSTLRPLSAEMTSDERRAFNRSWYWRNRGSFLSNPEYLGKVLLVDDGKVMAVFDDAIDAQKYQARNDQCFLTIVGDEEYYKRVYAEEQETVFLKTSDLIPGGFTLTPMMLQDFSMKCLYLGGKRPYLLLPVRIPKQKPDLVLPTWFLVDTGSPQTTLEENTARSLFGKVPTEPSFILDIAVKGFGVEERVVCSLGADYYKDVNRLGTDFIFRGDILFSKAKKLLFT